MMIMSTAISLVFLLLLPTLCYSWQEWNYTSTPNDEYKQLWLRDGLGERRGHSLLLLNESQIILFAGRGNDAHRPHVPQTFELVEIEGVLEFATHDNKPLSSNYSPNNPRCQPVETCIPLSDSENDKVCSYSWDNLIHNTSQNEQVKIEEACGFVPAAVHYNDVWVLDTDCVRYADLFCENDGWRILHPGKTFGGCNKENGELVCETPSERYGHGAVMLNETTMAIYGGYSNECHDYCDDFWLFDIPSVQWSKVESSTITPGNRWEFSMVSDGASIYLFGGHRLWHGFSDDNNVENRWESDNELPKGGYLNDLWVFSNSNNTWHKVEGKTTCIDNPGLTWESRNDKHCEIYWPSARSGHAVVYDEKRGGMWLHGGYSTYYPYPTSKSAGSSFGNRELGREVTALIPTWQFYLDDLWFYDFNSGYWTKKKTFGRKPQQRTDHIISLSDDIIVLHGGFGDNEHFNDTWYYLIHENRWLEKKEFVHAEYPETCNDDMEAIQDDPSCVELEFPNDLRRSNETTLALKYQDILPFSEQKGYTPDPDYPLYFGIVNDAEEFVEELRQKYQEVYDDSNGQRIWLKSTVPDGTPIAPKAASAPRQYARRKIIRYNETTNLEVWEWCISVKGEPTRDRKDDGKFGRSNTSIFIPQPRRQSPGWDGCRELEWKYPPARADHASVFVAKHDMLVTHGGISYTSPANDTYPSLNQARVLSDMWVLNMHNCAHNCSNHGVCTNGFCECDPGYYGMDCSNVTCPGSVCEYDANRNQHCTHCCYDTIDERRVPCNLMDDELMLFSGTTEGICDGFGTCQCAEPYIGEDCSILDCKHNCSFNGYCIVEFPQSRCMCKDGYTGEFCQHKECLNNCSYPNGVCDQETGFCDCATLYNPYDRTKVWDKWQGLDCSYLPAFSSASRLVGSIAFLGILIFVLLLHLSYHYPLDMY